MSEITPLAQFAQQNYLNLETFRKTGEGVKTPVWFVEDGGKLYIRTVASSGKVKRLLRNGEVRVAPCTANGSLLGEWMPAQGQVITDAGTGKRVNNLMNRKYGLLKRAFDLQGLVTRAQMTTIEICP